MESLETGAAMKNYLIPETWCVYCGDFNECQDHITPVAWTHVARGMTNTPTVDCCNMCNGLAGDFLAYTIAEKATHLITRYESKYGRYCGGSMWTMKELNELEGMLKDYIWNIHFMRVLIREKLLNLELVEDGFPIKPLRVYNCDVVRDTANQIFNDVKLSRAQQLAKL